ncbi:hypothetical protein GAY29_21165 [Azospirillum brasilense]|uniref:hypothetical protein n=1 Tax=Azospirillum brasilense TaxID=192 RepID=UPI00190E4967|nr:hypothetical protein [Azospirillum brasilense]MBK3735565.1 hypothetical protein [Azospirillum brasilense]
MTTLTLKADMSAAIAVLSEINDACRNLELDLLREVVDGLLEGGDIASEFRLVQCDACPTGAGQLAIRFDPSNRLLGLPAALRARNLDALTVEAEGHF